MVEKHSEAIPLAVPVVSDDRQQSLHLGFRLYLCLPHLKTSSDHTIYQKT